MQTDEQIIEQIQKGEIEKYEVVLKRYQGKLFGYIKNLINQSHEEVEDVVAEILISAYINLQSFKTDKKFSSWLFRIAHNKAVDYFKKKRIVLVNSNKNAEDWLENIPANSKLLEEIEIEKENKQKINKAIELLDLKYKEVVILYFFEEKTYEEISDILHIPTSNVGVLLYRSKEKLKKYLKANYEK